MRVLMLLAVVALASCGPDVIWQKPGASEQDLDRDASGCRAQADASQGMTSDAQKALIVYSGCMESKGWRRVQAPKP